MGHRLILGGERFLPFARSCVTKLKKLGLPYADQSYEVDGVSIKVRIQPGHEYIRIEDRVSVLSGAIRGGQIFEPPVPDGSPPDTLPVRVLRDFKATAQASKYASGGSATAFHDMGRLVVEAAPSLSVGTGSQYTHVVSSMYSGMMAKVVQFVLGYGRGVQVVYDFHWARCHGAVTAADGRIWLLEISSTNGVIAMPLPLSAQLTKAKMVASPQDVIRVAGETFGGAPTGATFPTGDALTAAITSGDVLQLKTAAEMSPYFTKSGYSSALGWSFNDTGSEAHNTCYATDGAGEVTGYHYRIDILIGMTNLPRLPDSPIATGSAALVLVESGPLWWWGDGGVARDIPFAFFDPTTSLMAPMPGKVIATSEPAHLASTALTTPILVCHINGVLDTVRIRSDAAGTTGAVGGAPPYNISPTYANGAERYVATGNLTEMRYGYTVTQRTLLPSVSIASGFTDVNYGTMRPSGTPSNVTTTVNTFEYVGVSDKTQDVGLSSAVWADGMRDGYVQFREGAAYQDFETYVYIYHCGVVENSYDPNAPGQPDTVYAYDMDYYHAGTTVHNGLFPELSALLVGKFDLDGFAHISPILFNAHASLTYRPFEWGADGQWGYTRYVADAYYQNKVLTAAPNSPTQEYTYPGLDSTLIVNEGKYWRNFPIWPTDPFRVACSMLGSSEAVSILNTELIDGVPTHNVTTERPGALLSGEANPHTEKYSFIGHI
jgi:hypothetical protein